jgi:autotransporter-associated beta strand protein
MLKLRSKAQLRALLGLIICQLVPSAHSQVTWDGGGTDNNWSTPDNWVGNAAPGNDGSADLVFDGSTRTTPNVDMAWSIASLTFASTAGGFTIGGSDISPPSTVPVSFTDFVVNNSVTTETINNNIGTLNNEAFNAASGDLVFGGNIATTGNGLDVKGAGNTTINGNITGDGYLTKDGSGTLTVNGANTYSLSTYINSGTFQVNGSLTASPTVNVYAGGTLTGNGSISGDVILGNNGVPATYNGIIAPGNGIGTFTVGGAMTWNIDAHYLWEINKAAGTAGSNPGWDFLAINGGLIINATSSDTFKLHVISLGGPVSDFNSSQNWSWRILTASGGISSFDPSKFAIDTSQFQNSLNGGSFSLAVNGNDLDLNFTAVPEPSACAALTGLALLAFAAARKVRWSSSQNQRV